MGFKLIAVALTRIRGIPSVSSRFSSGSDRIGNDIFCKVQDLLQQYGADSPASGQCGWGYPEVPDVGLDGRGQLNVVYVPLHGEPLPLVFDTAADRQILPL